MRRAVTPLFFAGVFLFIGFLYLAFFASSQKSWAQCASGSPYACIGGCALAKFACGSSAVCNAAYNICVANCYAACATPTPTRPPPGCWNTYGGICMDFGDYSCGPYIEIPSGNAQCRSAFNDPTYRCCDNGLVSCSGQGGSCINSCTPDIGTRARSADAYCSQLSRGYAPYCCVIPGSPPAPPPSNPVGSPCYTPQGSGICRDRNVTACSGGSYVPGYCPGGTNIQCCVPAPRYNITGTVFVDTDRDGNRDSGEAGYSRTVSMSGAASASTTSNSNGDFAFNSYLAGNYTISISVPSGYAATIPNPPSRSVSIGPNRSGINFGIVPLYSLSGSVFNDLSKNHLKEAGEEKDWSGNIAITKSTSDGNLSIDHDAGTYTITNLFAGTYTITYNTTTTPVPTGYDIIWPRPTAWQVTVGHNCPSSVRTDDGHTCTNGNLSNVNFAISNSRPWVQVFGFNIRLDSGFTSKIPVSPWYPRFASVADNESAISNLVTPTPTRTPTPTPTRTPTPTPTRTPTPTQPPPNWGNCNAAGRAGVCYDRNTTPCGTYYDAGNYCPGGNSVQCCVNSQVSCRSTGQCHNRYANSGGNIYNCTQNWYSGYCPGPFDVQCCAP